jgi:excisionase family DNA binding protein
MEVPAKSTRRGNQAAITTPVAWPCDAQGKKEKQLNRALEALAESLSASKDRRAHHQDNGRWMNRSTISTSLAIENDTGFFDAEQAAIHLGGINHRTVTRWAREGYLPAYPVGEGMRRLWRFRRADLDQWMLSRRTGQFPLDVPAGTDTLNPSHRCSDQRKIQ